MNAVESLLTRLDISEALPKFRALAITKVVDLRSLPEDKLREAIPDEAKRRKLQEALTNRGSANTRPGPAPIIPNVRYPEDEGGRQPHEGRGRGRGGRGGYSGRGRGGHPDGDSKSRPCRQFFTPDGCKFGDNCKYSHDQEVYRRESESASALPRSDNSIGRESYFEFVDVPTDSLKFLLGNKAERIRQINERCGTTNERVQGSDASIETFKLKVFGTPDAVKRARQEIDRIVGNKFRDEEQARFDYANNELERNQHSCSLLAAANLRHANTPLAFSEDFLRKVVSTFRFAAKPQIHHVFANTPFADKEKFETISQVFSQMKGVQAIVFAEQNRVVEMQKNYQKIQRHFNGVKAYFLQPTMKKLERLETLEAFKKGEAEHNEHGVRQRLLFATNDYAKYARKTLIPYINTVIHLSMPKTKECYLVQSMCCGRQHTVGLSLMLVTPYEVGVFSQEWLQPMGFEEFSDVSAITPVLSKLSYDTLSKPLTADEADPPINWRDSLDPEKADARCMPSKKGVKESANK